MNQISRQAIQALRRETRAGILECKNALVQTQGQVEKAMELLLQSGSAIAEKKTERVAAEGVAYATVVEDTAILLEVNTETDFVAANREFLANVQQIAETIARSHPVSVDQLLQTPVPGTGETVAVLLQKMALAFREKIVLRRFATLQGSMAVAYTHQSGQYGAILTLSAQGIIPKSQWEPVARELALQIAASAPRYVSREAISARERRRMEADVAHEIRHDPATSGKPSHIQDKIQAGRMEKFYRTTCLLEQPYIRNGDQSVGEYLRAATAQWAVPVWVDGYHRYQAAEGLQNAGEQSSLAYARQLAAGSDAG